MAERDVQHVTVEFVGGPMDTWSSGQMTDAPMHTLPGLWVPGGSGSTNGAYRRTEPRPGHYLYQWVDFQVLGRTAS
jgi:hypothetical protein